MQFTDATAADPRGSASGETCHEGAQGGCVKTELLFAADDSSSVDAFHTGTKWGRTLDRTLSSRISAFLGNPAMWAMVARSRNEHRDAESIVLPDAGLGAVALQEALLSRRSLAAGANPGGGAIDVDDLAAILKYSYGVVGERRAGAGWPVQRLRPCPSAGALYPLEIYPVVMDVAGLASGVYHYDAVAHSLSCLRREDARAAMPGFDFQPEFKSHASVVFIVTAVLLRSMAKYRDRGYRFVMNEAGALTQNMHLTTLARGLPGCIWGGYCDEDVAAYVGADGVKEIVVLGFIVGHRAPREKTTT